MKVPIYDLSKKLEGERASILDRIERVLTHGQLIMGEEVHQFEEAIAQYCGRRYAVGVGSGSDALLLALKALGITTGDEVITTSLSWIATANAIALTGATPVFADIRDDLNIDPDSIESLISDHTKAILMVDFAGKVCDVDAIMAVASRHGLQVVEDGSQAFGASYSGRLCGSFGTVSAISHNPMKVLSACGEAGTVLCDDPAIHERLLALRHNGVMNGQDCIEPSINGRLDTIQAAVLLESLSHVDTHITARRAKAASYDRLLKEHVMLPPRSAIHNDVFYSYTIRSSDRDGLMRFLGENGVETKVYHSPLMPEHSAYRGKTRATTQRASVIVEEILSLPISESVTQEQVEYVASKVIEFGDTRPLA